MAVTRDGWPITEVYIDESSQTKHRYLILGALVIPITLREKLTNDI